MARQQDFMAKILLACAAIVSATSALTLPYQTTLKPRHTKFTTSTAKPAASSGPVVVTPSTTKSDEGVAVYRLTTHNGGTCILMKTDAVVEVNFLLHGLEEQADAFIPEKVVIEGTCDEDASLMRISWASDYVLVLNFAKTPGGERWYINGVELTVSPEANQLKGIDTRGKYIKLYHKGMLIPTPVGKSYSCEEIDIDLEMDPDDEKYLPKGLRGSLLLRLLQLQPFMYKGEDFGPSFECRAHQKSFRDETAPIAVGSTLAIAVLMTVTGYGIFRYFKVKNVQYNTME